MVNFPDRKGKSSQKSRTIRPEISNDLKRAVEANQGSLRFDSEAKHILSFKSVLAGIVKECIPAFKKVPIAEVIHRIESVQFRESSVDGLRNKPTGEERIHGKSTESIEANPDEGKILFDVLFEITDPSEKKLLVNIELQNGFLSREWLDKRGIYYLARLISGQKGRFFTGTDYEKIQEIWSIWICLIQGKPFYRRIQPEVDSKTLQGIRSEFPKLMNLVEIGVPVNILKNPPVNSAQKLLSAFFSDNMYLEERFTTIRNFGIPLEKEAEGEIKMLYTAFDSAIDRTIEETWWKAMKECKKIARKEVRNEDYRQFDVERQKTKLLGQKMKAAGRTEEFIEAIDDRKKLQKLFIEFQLYENGSQPSRNKSKKKHIKKKSESRRN